LLLLLLLLLLLRSGGHDTRPESAAGDRSTGIGADAAASGTDRVSSGAGRGGDAAVASDGADGGGGHKLNLPGAGGLPRSIGDGNSASRPNISSRSRPESGSAGLSGGGGGGSSRGGSAAPGATNRAWSDSIRSGSAGGGAVVRRPQSAHGARSSPKTATAVRQNSYNGVQGGGNDAYVVAGAKSMMTYRRSRGSNYPTDNMRTTASGQRIGDDGNPAWGRPKPSGRPKSAGLIGSRMGSSGGNSGSSQGNASGGGGRSSGAGRSGSNGRAPYYMTQVRGTEERGEAPSTRARACVYFLCSSPQKNDLSLTNRLHSRTTNRLGIGAA
jgi:hypothetical protein